MLAVLNKRWLTMGWRVMDPKDSEIMALAWIEILDREGVPHGQYMELYRRAIGIRTRRFEQGLKCDDFSADLIVACWPVLRAELKQREIDAGRTLTATAASQCLRCYGTGLETIYDEEGQKVGVKPGCQHEHIDESEPSTGGIDRVIDSVHRPVPDETAVDICSRVRQSLARDVVMATDQAASQRAWVASRTWAHAEKYCRNLDAATPALAQYRGDTREGY